MYFNFSPDFPVLYSYFHFQTLFSSIIILINKNYVFINMRGNRYSNDSRNLKTVSMYISISTHRKYHYVIWNIVLLELHYESFYILIMQTEYNN